MPLRVLRSDGTDHALFRLGEKYLVRLPRTAAAARQRQKEHVWLPKLAPQLPLRIPEPLLLVRPDASFPFPWSLYAWLPGEPASLRPPANLSGTARRLAGFIRRLRALNAKSGPAPGADNFGRGLPLATRDRAFRLSLAKMPEPQFDRAQLLEHWEACLAAPPWRAPPVWVHGDLKEDNLLVVNGEVCAVIDFGGLGVGDPAVDLLIAWSLLDAPAREVFRRALEVDAATWQRGRGWALSVAVLAIPFYRDGNPAMAAYGLRLLQSALSEAT